MSDPIITIFKTLPDGREVTRDIRSSEAIRWVRNGWWFQHVREGYRRVPPTYMRAQQNNPTLNIIRRMGQRGLQALRKVVKIRKGVHKAYATYLDFLSRWRGNGWRMAENLPKPKAIVNRKKAIGVAETLIRTPRNSHEVRYELQWYRSPIREQIYAKTRPDQYAREKRMLAESNRYMINPEWFIWAARAVRWHYVRRRIYGSDTGWDNRYEDELLGLLNFDAYQRRKYGRSAMQEPPRVVPIEQLPEDYTQHWVN